MVRVDGGGFMGVFGLQANVEGKFCDRCKSGHFALRSDNSVGCSACYCSGVTTLCESAFLVSKTVRLLNPLQFRNSYNFNSFALDRFTERLANNRYKSSDDRETFGG